MCQLPRILYLSFIDFDSSIFQKNVVEFSQMSHNTLFAKPFNFQYLYINFLTVNTINFFLKLLCHCIFTCTCFLVMVFYLITGTEQLKHQLFYYVYNFFKVYIITTKHKYYPLSIYTNYATLLVFYVQLCIIIYNQLKMKLLLILLYFIHRLIIQIKKMKREIIVSSIQESTHFKKIMYSYESFNTTLKYMNSNKAFSNKIYIFLK